MTLTDQEIDEIVDWQLDKLPRVSSIRRAAEVMPNHDCSGMVEYCTWDTSLDAASWPKPVRRSDLSRFKWSDELKDD